MGNAVNDNPKPVPYPADTRAKGWRFELDHERIRQSDTWALATPAQRPWLLLLWMVAWEQVPCGSLPDDDGLIAARLGMPRQDFVAGREALMRGWWRADDGRLYHDTVTIRVKAMLEAKEGERKRKAEWRARKETERSGKLSPSCPTGQTWDSHGTDGVRDGVSDDTGTGTGTIYTAAPLQQARPVDNLASPDEHVSGEGFEVDLEGYEPTPEGKAAQRLRAAGITQAVPNTALRKVLGAGLSVERLLELAPAALKDGVGDPYAYLLTSARNALQAKGREAARPEPAGAVVAGAADTATVLATLTVTPERKAEAARGAGHARAWLARNRRPSCS